MNRAALQSWMQRALALDGVLAAGGGVDFQSGFSAVATGELVMAGDDAVWRALATSLRGMQAGGAAMEELLWGFEHAVLCTVLRPDGAWLGVFTSPKLSDDAALAVRARLDEFKGRAF